MRPKTNPKEFLIRCSLFATGFSLLLYASKLGDSSAALYCIFVGLGFLLLGWISP